MTVPSPNWHDARCHCGAVRFRVRRPVDLAAALRCNCSFCRMRGAVAVPIRPGDIEILQGHENLTLYRFNTGTAAHYFCKTCGIYTHHQRRSDPNLFAVNIACLDGVSPFDLAEVPVFDGQSHPSDTGGPSRIAGILRFIALP